MAGWLNEEKTAVNTCVLNVAFPLSCEFLAEVGRVLILDVFDDGVPATTVSTNLSCLFLTREIVPSVIVDLITVSGGIDDVKPQTYTVFFDDYIHKTLSMLCFLNT
jgi:hypothetical protein